jgi:hypothetical protein
MTSASPNSLIPPLEQDITDRLSEIEADPPETIVDEADLILPSDTSSLPLPPITLTHSPRQISLSPPLPSTTQQDDAEAYKPDLPNDRVPIPLPARPLLPRGSSAPAPPLQSDLPVDSDLADNDMQLPPLPVPPTPDADDSLTLAQLRQIVADGGIQPPTTNLPVTGGQLFERSPYAFTYSDAASLPAELDEWFTYGIEERARVARAQASFGVRWAAWRGLSPFGGSGGEWLGAGEEVRESFIREVITGLSDENRDKDEKLRELETLTYISLGVWGETACLMAESKSDIFGSDSGISEGGEEKYEKSGLQVEWIKRNTDLIFECGGLPIILHLFKKASENAW